LQFYFSKYLIDNSELEVLVNDQAIKKIPLNGVNGNQLMTEELETPHQILTANNLITYKFKGHCIEQLRGSKRLPFMVCIG
jgi:hypothetical protein